MVQLKILTGNQAGVVQIVPKYPFTIGRAAGADLRLEEPGIWDQHLKLDLELPAGFVLHRQPNALARLNGESFEKTILRNADVIELGPVKLQFGLSETRQPDFKWRERLTWAALVALFAFQAWLIYYLAQ